MPVVPLTARFEMEMRSTGAATAFNILHLLDIGGTFNQAMVDDVVTAWITELGPVVNANWVLQGTVRALDLSVDPPTELYSDVSNANGGTSGSALPPACCAVISLVAGAARRRRGRIYLAGQTESEWTDDGQEAAAQASDIANAFTDFATAVASGPGYVPAVYSRADGVARVVQTINVDGTLDTQRRRQARLA